MRVLDVRIDPSDGKDAPLQTNAVQTNLRDGIVRQVQQLSRMTAHLLR